MRYDNFKAQKYKRGITPCVVISTGEEGVIIDMHKNADEIMVRITRPRYKGKHERWFNYVEIDTW